MIEGKRLISSSFQSFNFISQGTKAFFFSLSLNLYSQRWVLPLPVGIATHLLWRVQSNSTSKIIPPLRKIVRSMPLPKRFLSNKRCFPMANFSFFFLSGWTSSSISTWSKPRGTPNSIQRIREKCARCNTADQTNIQMIDRLFFRWTTKKRNHPSLCTHPSPLVIPSYYKSFSMVMSTFVPLNSAIYEFVSPMPNSLSSKRFSLAFTEWTGIEI